MEFPKLFQPGAIGELELKNRLVMAPMGTSSFDAEGYVTERTVDFYVARAEGGVGLIMGQGSPVLKECWAPERPYIYDDRFIPGLRDLAQAVHKSGGKIAWQLAHLGKGLSLAKHKAPRPDDVIPLGPSSVPLLRNGTVPKEATKEDIARVVEGFARAARRAQEAGFDAVEIHGAHGSLITQFRSPLDNKRTDEYGGSAENRARFACEVIARTRAVVGADFPIVFRFSGCSYLEGGITIEDSLVQAPLFVKAGADALDVSAGELETYQRAIPCYLYPDALNVHLAAAVKKVVNVPVIAVGKIGDPALAESILAEGKADFIAMGRALFADPDLPRKAREGRLQDIRRCITCNNCLLFMRRGGVASCTVNPALLREREFATLKPATSPKKVMVVGGGIAGMEAAQLLAERGHEVSLYEANDKLGGQWNIACHQPHKEGYASLTRYLERGLHEAHVKVTLNKRVTLDFIKEQRPDALVLAAGASPVRLRIPGIEGDNVVQAVDVITGKATMKDRVVVIGGRFIGMEVADFLARRGKHVSLVTQKGLGEDGLPLEMMTYSALRDSLIESGVRLYLHSPVVEIKGDGVYINFQRALVFLKADTVVLAVGARSDRSLLDAARAVVPEVYPIGDCAEPRDAMQAMREGAEVGRGI